MSRSLSNVRYAILAALALVASFLFAIAPTATAAPATGVGAPPAGSAQVKGGQLTRASQQPSPFASAEKPSASPEAIANPPLMSKPGLKANSVHGPNAANGANPAIPNVSCAPALTGCDTVGVTNGGADTNPHAMAATLNGQLYGQDIEPPDQGLCAGNGYVMEVINIGELQVYTPQLAPESAPVTLDNLMGLPALGWSSGGDIMCLYDPDSGGHWFVTEFVSTNTEASGGPFTGCFAGVMDACREGLAVSSGNNPLTSTWSVYFLDPNTLSPTDPGAGFLLNDFAKMGNTRDALLLFYDEFNLGTSVPACPAYGCAGFNGSQELALQKSALEAGDATVNMVHENMGTDPAIQPPGQSCFTGPTAGVTCWFQDIPATSPSDAQFDNNFGGTGFIVGALDFTGTGDNRVAVFYWTGLDDLNTPGCSGCSGITFGSQLFTGVEPYLNEGANCPASQGGLCSLGAQKAGILDLGTYCKKLVPGATTPKCPENGIATNGDGATQASYSDGNIWFAISTLINQMFGSSSEIHTGAAYWVVSTSSFTGATPRLTLTSQAYATDAHEDLEFPTLVGGTGGNAIMSFTLSGNGGPTGADSGGYFPSSAFGRVTTTSPGLVGATMYVAALGQAPQDGFTEYQPLPTIPRPRWGDYGAAVFVPGQGFYFASEYIPYPNCEPSYFFKVDRTCGGTRDQNANFGTSLNFVG